MTQQTKVSYCKFCGNRFPHTRDDAEFCNPRCKAAWTRNEGYNRERFHEEKAEVNTKACEHCGTEFFFNTYAQRGGQRVPQYCSNRCRQAAFRKRNKQSGFDGGANHWQEGRADKTQRKGTSHTGTEREKQDRQDNARAEREREKYRYEQTYKGTSQQGGKGTSQDTNKGTSQNQHGKGTSHADARWDSKDPRIVLGVTYLSNKAQIKSAYMNLVKQWHPDRCKDPNANYIMQRINAAWDKLK